MVDMLFDHEPARSPQHGDNAKAKCHLFAPAAGLQQAFAVRVPLRFACNIFSLLGIPLFYKVLRDGAEAADEVASETLGWAKEAMGIPSLRDLQQ